MGQPLPQSPKKPVRTVHSGKLGSEYSLSKKSHNELHNIRKEIAAIRKKLAVLEARKAALECEARSIFRTSSSDRSETSPAGRRDARTRLRDLRGVHRIRLVAALDLACIERDRGPDVTGHDDQHLMWGALIRRSVVCCTPAPAPAPLSLRDDRVEGATTELTAVGGPRVRISLPPAVSSVVEPRAPGRRSPWDV